MNRLLKICGWVLLAGTTVAANQQSNRTALLAENELLSTGIFKDQKAALKFFFKSSTAKSSSVHIGDEETYVLNLDDIVFVEEEEDIDLGFDTQDYLPQDFDPHKIYFDFDAIEYIEEEGDTVLNFDTAPFLPEGFDAYSWELPINSISFMEEESLDLGFDTAEYLPEGFSPYEVYFDINSIVYIEDEEEFEIETTLCNYENSKLYR